MGKRKKSRIKEIRSKLKYLTIFSLIALLLFGLWEFKDILFPSYPEIVGRYKLRYNEMNKQDYIIKLLQFTRNELNDPIEGLNYTQLLAWVNRHFHYWTGLLYTRPELPIDILTTNNFGAVRLKDGTEAYAVYDSYLRKLIVYSIVQENDILEFRPFGFTVGRCGEFALLYAGLCLANNLKVRIVVDCSIATSNKYAGDHVWNEIWINGTWMHLETTEACDQYPNFQNYINHPEMYTERWGKEVNRVFAIEGNEVTEVTSTYAD